MDHSSFPVTEYECLLASVILRESRWFSWPIIFTPLKSMEWPASLACSDTEDLKSQVYVLAIGSKRKEVELLKVVE